jgi:hypothetical protein
VAGPAHVDEKTRRANRRLAIVLAIVAIGFYLLMVTFNPS